MKNLTLSTWSKIFSRRYIEISFIFFPENKIWHFKQIVSLETICMKCQNLFSGKNKKYITNLFSAELAQKMVKVKYKLSLQYYSFSIFSTLWRKSNSLKYQLLILNSASENLKHMHRYKIAYVKGKDPSKPTGSDICCANMPSYHLSISGLVQNLVIYTDWRSYLNISVLGPYHPGTSRLLIMTAVDNILICTYIFLYFRENKTA